LSSGDSIEGGSGGLGCGGGSNRQIERGWIERGGSSEENEGVRRIDLSRVSSDERGK
jgi:hypothetical protein